MPSSNVCWGIELGAGAVKAVKLERDGDGVRLLDFAVIPHKRVLSSPDIDQNEATRVALGTLVSQHDLSGAMVAISVPGHSAFARFAKLPPVEKKKIPDIVKFEAVQQIPFPIDEVEWDYQTFQSPDSPDVEVGIFAITRDRVLERLAMWADVGVTPDVVTLSPVAVYNALAWDLNFGPSTPGTVILDVGTTSTDLIVAEAARVWIRTFPLGGHRFTEALVDTFKLSYQKAERLKRESETSKHARHVFQAMRPVFSDLAQDVQRSIGYYQSLHRDANLTRLIGLGSTFNLPGLRKYLSQQLQMEVVRLDHFHRMTGEGPRAGEFQAATLNLTTAYGCALQGLGFELINANLMPSSVMREAMWRRKVKWFAVAAGVALAAGGLSFIKPVTQKTAVESAPKQPVITNVKNDLQRLRTAWKEVEGKFAPNPGAANAMLLVDDRAIIPYVVDDLGQIMAGAAGAAGDQPGLIFQNFRTDYVGGGTRVGMAPAGDPYDVYITPNEGRGGGAAVPDGGAPPIDGAPGRRIQVTLDVSTVRPNADSFITGSVSAWLTQNKQREGVPYIIHYKGWRISSERIAEAGRETGPQLTGVVGDTGRRPPDRLGGARQPAGELLTEGGGRDDRPPRRGPGGGGGGGPLSEGDPEKLAPLPPGEPLAKPGETLRTYEVIWEIEVIPQTEGQA